MRKKPAPSSVLSLLSFCLLAAALISLTLLLLLPARRASQLHPFASSAPPFSLDPPALPAPLLNALPGERLAFSTVARTLASRTELLCAGPSCVGQRFFFVDQHRSSSDGILSYLMRTELEVQEVFATVLASDRCDGVLRGGATPWCAHQPRKEGSPPLPPPVVMDVGSNAGFYSLLAASMGARVVAVDPQPHCVQYLRAAAQLSGLAGRGRVLNAFAGGGGEAGGGDAPTPVPLRSGCWGTYPLVDAQQEASTRAEYHALPGGRGAAAVPSLPLPALVRELSALGAPGEGVLLLKMDVEGAEDSLVAALDESGVLGERLVKNFLLELNQRAVSGAYGGSACAQDLPACYERLMQRFLSAGYVPLVARRRNQTWASQAPIASAAQFARGGLGRWHVVDLWLYLPRP